MRVPSRTAKRAPRAADAATPRAGREPGRIPVFRPYVGTVQPDLVQRTEGPLRPVGDPSPKAAPAAAAPPPGGGRPLPQPTRGFFESRLGHDFGDVRVHTGNAAARSADDLAARAYTKGADIVFGPSQYDPGSRDGRRLLAHELVHVLQQRSADSPQPIRRSPKVTSVSTCNPAGFTPRNVKGVIDNPQGEVAYTVNGVPTEGDLAGTPGRDHENKVIKLFPSDGEIELGQIGYGYWTAVCLQIPQREKPEVHWVRSGKISTKKAEESAPAAKESAPAAGSQAKAWSGSFSEFANKSDDQIADLLRTLLVPELVRVAAEAEARGAGKVTAQAALLLDDYIAASPAAGEFFGFEAAAAQADGTAAVSALERLATIDEIHMFLARVGASARAAIHGAAVQGASSSSGAAHVLEAVEEHQRLVNEVTLYVTAEGHLRTYRKYFAKDWQKAAEALAHFSDEAIFLELRQITDNDQLRALRKAADRQSLVKVSMIVSALIAAQDKTGVYIESLAELAFLGSVSQIPGAAQLAELSGVIDPRWSDDFVKGLIDGGLDTTLGDAWSTVEKELSSATNVAHFVAGYYPGLLAGIVKDLARNVEDVALLIAKLVEYNVRLQYEPVEVLKEVAGVIEGLAKMLLSTLDAREFGYTVGRMLGGKIESDFTQKTPFHKGLEVGTLVGMVATEIALLFIGVGEATAALKAVRGTKLVMHVEKAVASSATLRKFMTGMSGSKAVKLLKGELGLGKSVGLLKTADAAADLGKADDILIELAKLEKAGDGPLIAKQMEPLEHAVLVEKVKSPDNIRLPKKPYHTKYTMEVKVGDHVYRRRPDGSWCRFSPVTCGYLIDDGLPHGMSIREREVLPSDIGNGKAQTGRGNLRTRMKSAFDGFQLPGWATTKPSNWDAHHVIPWEFLDHGVFNVLRDKGLVWDHNAMKNAIALPTKKEIPGAEHLPLHQAKSPGVRGHPVYSERVRHRLDALLDKHELNPAALKSGVDDLLADLKGQIESGRWAGVEQF